MKQLCKFVFIFLMAIGSTLTHASSDSEILTALTPLALYKEGFASSLSSEDIKNKFLRAITIPANDESAAIFSRLAQHGHTPSIINLGKLAQKHSQLLIAYEWYMLAFQLEAWQHSKACSWAVKALQSLNCKDLNPTTRKNLTYFLKNIAQTVTAIRQPLDTWQQRTWMKDFNGQMHDNIDIIANYRHFALSHEDYTQANYKFAYIMCAVAPPDYLCFIGGMYFMAQLGGKLIELQRYLLSKELFQKANTAKSLFYLALMYEQGKIGHDLTPPQRYEKAARIYIKSGTADARCNLGNMYMQRKIGQELTLERSQEIAEKLFLAADTTIARCYLGILSWHNKTWALAEKNFTDSMIIPLSKYYLGVMTLEGKINLHLSQQQRDEEAARLFRQSGTIDALCCLGFMYEEGKIGADLEGNPDFQEAAKLYRASGSDLAKYCLANLYFFKRIEPELSPQRRNEQVASLYKESPIPEAKCYLGRMYEEGKIGLNVHGQPNISEAIRLYREADTPMAKYYLAGLYYPGFIDFNLPRQEHLDTAAELYRASNTARGKYILSLMYGQKIIGQTLSPEERYTLVEALLLEALTGGIIEAQIMLDRLKAPLTAASSVLEAAPPLRKAERKQFKQRLAHERRLKILQEFGMGLIVSGERELPVSLQLSFSSEAVKADFAALENNKKVESIFEDIAQQPWGTLGEGKPELLKYGIYKGCISRRINKVDRLIYQVIDAPTRQIQIIQCRGHYDD